MSCTLGKVGKPGMWFKAEMKGLKLVVGETTATLLLRGCRVHWIRSCQRVCDCVASSTDKGKEKAVFRKLASAITSLDDRTHIIACFQALCGEKTVSAVLKQIPSLPVTKTEAAWADKNCNWSVAKHWASWWSKPEHLKMLCAPFANMSAETWELCPATVDRCSLSWASGRGLLEVCWGWTDAASAGHLEEVY